VWRRAYRGGEDFYEPQASPDAASTVVEQFEVRVLYRALLSPTPRKPGEGRAGGRRTREEERREDGPGERAGSKKESETPATAGGSRTGDRRGAGTKPGERAERLGGQDNSSRRW
jgi:hypothetical protein